jgi:sulfite reductase beta subunit-like hemoprotein
MPRLAPTLYEFVELDNGDYLKVTEACMRIFDRQEWLRANRARARIKVLVDKVGIDEFRSMVEEELGGDWVAERDFSLEGILFDHDEQAHAPGEPEQPASPNGDNREFGHFVESNVRPQRQDGFATVEVKVRRGDLTPDQLRGLGQIMREFTGGYARTTVHQNVVLRWVRDAAVYDLWRRLSELELGDAGADEITDVVSCPGTDSCKLGITSSMGLNQAIQDRRADPADPHQDERLPQRLRAAPHRQHRLLRRVDQGRRPRDSGLHPAHRRGVRGRGCPLRSTPEGEASGQARA